MINFIMISVTLILGIMRFYITPRLDLPTATGSYEAVAHMFVGGLLVSWWYTRKKLTLFLAIGISLLELVMFIVQKNVS